MCNRDVFYMCPLILSSVRNHPLINLSSIKDWSFDNILKSRIQMTNRLWRIDFNKLIKNSRNDKFKDQQTDHRPGTRSQQSEWTETEWRTLVFVSTISSAGPPRSVNRDVTLRAVMSSPGVKREVGECDEWSMEVEGECFLLSCYLDHGIESWPWSRRHLGPPPFTPDPHKSTHD